MSAVHALIGELQRLGVTLWHDGDRIRYRAPKGVLTPQLLDGLRQHKADLTSFLAGAADAATRGMDTTGPIERAGDGPAQLSFAQERLWFLHQFEGEDGPGAAYNVAAALRLRGTLDIAALTRTLNEVVRRHAILRTRFSPSDEGAVQIVEGGGVAPLRVVDLTATPEDERQGAARAVLEADAAHVFALDAGPPVRFLLLRLGDGDHILACVLHHLVTDGWSMWVLFRDISALYTAFASGAATPLPELTLQYADYAVHQRKTFTAEALAPALAYWRERMSGAPAVIELPLDRPRPPQQSYRGGLVRFELDRTLTGALKQLAQECGASLFMVLLAGYATLLAKYAGQSRVVVGTPVANRDRPDIEPLIGVFSNYIPLDVELSGDPTVRELMARVRRMTLDGYAHQHLPFEKLVDAAKPERRPGMAPLFQVALVLQNLPASPLALQGLEVEQLTIDRATAKLDLSALLEESGGVIRGELEYCSDLFEAASAARMTRDFVRVLDALARDPGARISELPLVQAAERAEMLDCWSGADVLHSDDGLVHERFHAQASRTPHALAVVAGGERLTYAELAARVSRLARHLVSLGVGTDARVAVCLPRTVDLIVAVLAVLEAGGAYVPLDSAHPPERLASIVSDAGADVLVTTSELRARVPTSGRVVCLDRDAEAIRGCASGPLRRPASSAQLAYVIYTSGSTGRPKGVMVEHRAVCSLVRALAEAVYARHRGPVHVALVASTVFDASVQQMFGCLLLGHALHVVDDDAKRSGEALLDFLESHEVALSDGTPSLLGLLLDAGLVTRPRLRLEHLLIGGEALPTRLIDRLHAQDAQRRIVVTNVYGPTECGVDNTFRTVQPGETLARAHVPIGRPLSNARVYVLDAEGEPAPVGVAGDIWIGGPCLARGYLGQPALTARAYRPDPFVAGARLYATGDRGRWTDDREIEFLGRSDDQVKVRGYRVELAEIEAALLRHAAVKESVVVVDGAGDAARLVAYVTCGAATPTVAALRDHLSTLLPAYMVPSAFMVLERLPLNASGKIDRARMPRVSGAQEMAQGTAYVEPRGAEEEALAAAWARVLGRERIGAGDHFFSLGGDSIKALQVVSRLRQAGLRLELRDLFLNPVLSALAPRLKPLVAHAIDHDSNAADVPLGPVQAAFLYHYPGPKHHFHQALLLAPCEAVNVDALNRAIAAVYAHHDALRMRFTFTKGTWVQSCDDAHTPPVAEVVDLSCAASGNDALAAHAAVAMAATDLARGPLFIACVYRLAHCERVLLAAHHLVVDGVSWRIVIEDLDAAYEQACAQRAVSLTPVADTYARWAAGMRKLAAGLTEDERRCWDRAEQATSGRLPLDAPEAQAFQRDRVERRIALTPQVTARLLTSAHDAYGTRMDDLLLAALGRALVAWCGGGRWQVLLESHGREPLWDGSDVSRTAGWFTARYPVVLDVEGPDDVGRQIKGVKEMLRGVPHGGGTYEAVRHLTGGAAPSAPLPAIAFNYLGQLGRELRTDRWTWVDEPTGAVIAPGAPLVHDLEIIGFVADDRLHVAIGYGRVRFSEATVARLATALECALIEIVEHTTHKQDRELTPSDIDYDGFDIDTLDAFVKNL